MLYFRPMFTLQTAVERLTTLTCTCSSGFPYINWLYKCVFVWFFLWFIVFSSDESIKFKGGKSCRKPKRLWETSSFVHFENIFKHLNTMMIIPFLCCVNDHVNIQTLLSSTNKIIWPRFEMLKAQVYVTWYNFNFICIQLFLLSCFGSLRYWVYRCLTGLERIKLILYIFCTHISVLTVSFW